MEAENLIHGLIGLLVSIPVILIAVYAGAAYIDPRSVESEREAK